MYLKFGDKQIVVIDALSYRIQM